MPKKKAKRGSGFGRAKKEKRARDKRHSKNLPGRPRRAPIGPKEEETLGGGTAHQSMAELLWGGSDVYLREMKKDEERWEARGLVQKAEAFILGAAENEYRRQKRGGKAEALRLREKALDMCAEAEHAANMRIIPFRMAARTVATLARRAAAHRVWAENGSLTSHATAFSMLIDMMKVRKEHTFAGAKDYLNAVFCYDQVFRADGCNTKSGESRGRQRLNANGDSINTGTAACDRRHTHPGHSTVTASTHRSTLEHAPTVLVPSAVPSVARARLPWTDAQELLDARHLSTTPHHREPRGGGRLEHGHVCQRTIPTCATRSRKPHAAAGA